MKLTFKDKVLGLYRRTVLKKPKLKIPMMILSVILLSFDRLIFNIRRGYRKYVVVLMTIMFAFVSCSFSSVIWGSGDYDFAVDPGLYYYETEESNASLAQEADIDIQADDYDPDAEDVYEDEEDEMDPENISDVSLLDTVSGTDILDSIDISEKVSEAAEDISGDEESVTFSRDDWMIVLVNKNHPIADDYTFTLGTISGSMRCDERIIPDLYSMIEAALKDGVNLLICSPYRDESRQQMLFDRKVAKYTAQGMSYMDAYKIASKTVTIPGTSEHQIGLALDIISNNYSSLNAGFGDTKAGKWIADHSYEYGFVVRYPEGKENITGIEYEPWHLRYVGKNAARILYEESITLEEFWEKYL